MASFWRTRRRADGAAPAHNGALTMASVPHDDDPELEAQLAHLDAIEQRHERLYAQQLAEAARREAASGEPLLPEEAWPAAIGDPPSPDTGSLAPYIAWLERARQVLGARAARNRDELQRLSSQWLHISGNLVRFRSEEVASVVESQSRVRERLAADETCSHLLLLVRAYLRALEEVAAAEAGGAELLGVPDDRRDPGGRPATEPAAAPPADVELVRRLLDDAAADRADDARRRLGVVLEALSAIALDMEVVQREADRDPSSAAAALRGLQDRLGGAVDDLRGEPGLVRVEPRPGEPFHATLRRCLEDYQPRLAGDVAWSGGDPASAEVRAAVLWIAQEFLAACAGAGAGRANLALTTTAEGSVLRLTADLRSAPPEAAEPGWVLRCRARAAVAGGSLAVSAGGWSELDVGFPAGSG